MGNEQSSCGCVRDDLKKDERVIGVALSNQSSKDIVAIRAMRDQVQLGHEIEKASEAGTHPASKLSQDTHKGAQSEAVSSLNNRSKNRPPDLVIRTKSEEEIGSKDSKREKIKTVSITDVGIYEGEVTTVGGNPGVPHGRGKLKLKNGDFYEGAFENGGFQGQGRMLAADGCEYLGSWQGNARHGKGIEKWPNGNWFEGEFEEDKKEGYGRFVWADGSSFEGNFKQGEYEGFGIYRWANDKTYEGDWKAGKMHGKGKLTYKNGDSYEGQFFKGKKHGKGIFKWAADGSYYDGEWNNNHPHGVGFVGKDNQSKKKAMYEDGKHVLWLDQE